jgi:hypothetical protein
MDRVWCSHRYVAPMPPLFVSKINSDKVGPWLYVATFRPSVSFIINSNKVYHGKYGFRINFMIGIVLNALSTITLYFWYHPPSTGKRLDGQTKWQAFKALDWTGLFLLNVGVILFLVSLSLGGATFPWNHPGVIAPLVISIVMFVIFAIWEAKLAKNPFFEKGLFRGQVSHG